MWNRSEIENILRSNFSDMKLIDELLDCKIAELEEGTLLLSEDEMVSIVPLLISGTIKVMKSDEGGKEILLYNIQKGESCALSISACLEQGKSKAFAICDEKSTLIILDGQKVRAWMERYSSWREFVIHLYNRRFNEMLESFDAVAFHKMDYRLSELLKAKFNNQLSRFINVKHSELASELGTAREVISRLLKIMERQGKIKNHRGKIENIALV